MRRTLSQIANHTMPARRYREGGHVRGPGTGTSDSINAKLSDGEFVLPADTVRKVGARRLRDLVDMTHTPVDTRGPNHLANGGFPKFDNDAFIQSMEQQREANTQASLAAGQAAMNQALADADAAAKRAPTQVPPPASSSSSPSPAPAPAAPASQSLEQRVSQIPTGGQTAPAADGSQNSWANTETGRNLSNMASALPGSLGGAIPAVAKTGGAISGGIDAATRLLNAGAGAAAISAIPGAASAQGPTASPAGAGRGMVNPPAVDPSAPTPVASPPTTSTGAPSTGSPATTSDVTRVGNSYSGANVAGDITVNGRVPGGGFMSTGDTSAPRSAVGMSPEEAARAGLITSATPVGYNPAYDTRLTGQGGRVSPQNTASADNLAARQDQGARGRLMALAGGPGSGPVEPGSFTGGYSGVIGSSSTYGNMRGRSPEQQLRDAEVSASSIMNRPQWGGRGAENSPAMIGYRATLQQSSNIRQNQAGAELEAMRQSGTLQREGMQQTGETERTGIRAQGVADANQINRGRLTLEQIAAGYTNRSADRIDRAQAELEGAKTPEAQKSARERLMALTGRAPQNEWGVQITPTTKNLDGSTTQGSVYRFNKATGETVRVDDGQSASPRVASQAQFDALPKGATYTGSDGRTYRKPV